MRWRYLSDVVGQPADSGGIDAISPRHVYHRFAVGEPLQGLLALVGVELARTANRTPRACARFGHSGADMRTLKLRPGPRLAGAFSLCALLR